MCVTWLRLVCVLSRLLEQPDSCRPSCHVKPALPFSQRRKLQLRVFPARGLSEQGQARVSPAQPLTGQNSDLQALLARRSPAKNLPTGAAVHVKVGPGVSPAL